MSKTDNSWKEVRARMASQVDAVFFQDLGIGGPEKQRSVDWILDVIIRPEMERLSGWPSQDRWSVLRQDDNGNEFVAVSGLSFREATARAFEYERRGHKQVYWVRRDET